jgi:glycosyltransferase involved in cell wall biosynthesis
MFNEKDNIDRTVDTIRSLAGELTSNYEVIIVDDASTDGSGEIIDEMARHDPAIRSFHMKQNTRFGGAFAEGFKQATKDVIIYMDSDMPVRVEDIKASLPLIRDAEIVTGCSSIKKGDTLKRKIISGSYNFLIQMFFKLSITDINSGYKIVKRDLIKDLEFVSHSPFIDVELFLHAKKKNARVHQFPLVFLSRTAGRSHIASLPIIWATFVDMLKVWILSKKR